MVVWQLTNCYVLKIHFDHLMTSWQLVCLLLQLCPAKNQTLQTGFSSREYSVSPLRSEAREIPLLTLDGKQKKCFFKYCIHSEQIYSQKRDRDGEALQFQRSPEELRVCPRQFGETGSFPPNVVFQPFFQDPEILGLCFAAVSLHLEQGSLCPSVTFRLNAS